MAAAAASASSSLRRACDDTLRGWLTWDPLRTPLELSSVSTRSTRRDAANAKRVAKQSTGGPAEFHCGRYVGMISGLPRGHAWEIGRYAARFVVNPDGALKAAADTRAGRLQVAALLGLILLAVAPAVLRPDPFFKDDSLFYLQIAANIAEGQGSTFHGMTPTNGYHPLWMAGSLLAMVLADGDRAVALRLVVVIQCLILLGVAGLFLRLARELDTDLPVLGLAVLLAYFLGTGLYGSEAHLNALVLVGGLLLLLRAVDSARWQSWAVAGAVLGLALLARLDNVFVLACVCVAALVYALGRDAGHAMRSALALGAGGTVVVAPYLAWNLAEFGHLNPISGAIKSTFPVFDLEVTRLGPFGGFAVAAGAAALLIGLAARPGARSRIVWVGLGAGVLLHAIYVAGFTDHYTFWAWYYVAGFVAAGLATSFIGAKIIGRVEAAVDWPGVRRLAAVAAVGLMCLVAVRAWLKAYDPLVIGPMRIASGFSEYRWAVELGGWLGRNLPAGSRLFVYDWPGGIAYYSGLPTLPMDGLVNDFAYNDELLARGAHDYLCTRGVSYYVGLEEEVLPVQRVVVYAPLYRQPAGVLELRVEDVVVRARDVLGRPAETLPFTVWKLRCDET